MKICNPTYILDKRIYRQYPEHKLSASLLSSIASYKSNEKELLTEVGSSFYAISQAEMSKNGE